MTAANATTFDDRVFSASSCKERAISAVNLRRACVGSSVWSVFPSICLSTTILGLQATRRLMKEINIFSATSARKIKWQFS